MMTKEGSTKTVKFMTPRVINIEDDTDAFYHCIIITFEKDLWMGKGKRGTECKYNFDDLYIN